MNPFSARCAIERLRAGLAANRLTVEENRIKTIFSKGLERLENGKSSHLCICGSYGQGKSHTLAYLNQLALSQGYATSTVQLDLREVPFHQFSTVYQSMMKELSLPDGKKFAYAWKHWADKDSLEFLDAMPHRFKMILTAMLCPPKDLFSKGNLLKPREHGYWLDKALMGSDIPLSHLKSICKYREVNGYREQSLLCRGNDSHMQMVQSLGRVLREMGYKGLVLFFDEAESITQGRLGHRAKSYPILDQFFQGNTFVFPIFAFTDDFFDQVNREQYDDPREIFSKNYTEEWRDLNILRLSEFSSHEWKSLLDHLMQLYSEAYQIDLSPQMQGELQSVLGQVQGQETRVKLKALVNKLDLATQHALL